MDEMSRAPINALAEAALRSVLEDLGWTGIEISFPDLITGRGVWVSVRRFGESNTWYATDKPLPVDGEDLECWLREAFCKACREHPPT